MANQELIKKWVAALRSGEYKQGKEYLRSGSEQYCCLGVLCDLVKEDVELDWEEREYTKSYKFGERSGFLPEKVMDLLGIDNDSVVIDINQPKTLEIWNKLDIDSKGFEGTNLITLNDKGISFSDIADVIEENYGT